MPNLTRFINFKGSASDLSDAAIKCGEDYGFKVDPDKTNERLVRYYAAEGVIDRPDRIGRDATYNYRHLLQLLTTRRLVDEGLSLTAIGDHNLQATTAELADNLNKPAPTEAELLVNSFKSSALSKKNNTGLPSPKGMRGPMAIPDVLAEVKRMKEDWIQEIKSVQRIRQDFDHLRKELQDQRSITQNSQDHFHETLTKMAHVSLEREEQFMQHIGQMIEKHTHIVKQETAQLREMVHETLDRLKDHTHRLEMQQMRTLDALEKIQKQLN